ncbi:hypothetical protein ACOME3_002510 [Neoechinorhynchus agilis]
MSNAAPRILSIQSHVVYGFVGNKCASFVLQTFGYNVDLINSVHFSNHTGYDKFDGCELSVKSLNNIVEALKANELTDGYQWILSGYMKSGEFIRNVANIVKDLKSTNHQLVFLCDPVMGDDGFMYVDKDSVNVYQNIMLQLSDVITPNYFEFQLLANVTLKEKLSVEQIVNEMKTLKKKQEDRSLLSSSFLVHLKGPSHIVITSIDHLDPDNLVLLGSTLNRKENGVQFQWFKIIIPKLKMKFTGTGDVFASLLTHYMIKEKSNLHKACKLTVVSMRHLLLATMRDSEELEYIRELRLIENRSLLQSISEKDFVDYGLDKLGNVNSC